jgi:lysophospholipase L1-like esterase
MALPPEHKHPPRPAPATAGFDPRSLLFWPALPLIAAQALWLRRRAYRAPAAAGDPQGVEGVGPPLRLLALGDSIIAGVGIERIEHALPGAFARTLAARWQRRVEWQALGRNGADVAGTRRLLAGARETLPAADLVLLSIGVNDTTGLSSRRRFLGGLQSLYAELREWSPKALLVHAGVPPLQAFPLLPAPLRQLLGLRAAQLDRLIPRALGAAPPGAHLPFTALPAAQRFAADGFHPDASACTIWAESLLDRLPRPSDAGPAAVKYS